MHIEGFLLALTNADKDGRIVMNKQGIAAEQLLQFTAIYFLNYL